MVNGHGNGDSIDDLHLKRLALQLVVQLPEKTTDALRVLELAQFIVSDFLTEQPDAHRPSAVVPFTIIR